MAIIRRESRTVKAVIFDFDETLLARDGAWSYALEEAVISVTGRRINARELACDYRGRPWRHALSVVLDRADEIGDCAELCQDIYERSAMKRLLVQEGIGMALDVLRGASIEVGAISREPHAIARRQIDSTGLDRFITVLSASPAPGRWEPAIRAEDCRSFLEKSVEQCVFVSGDSFDLKAVEAAGYRCLAAGWIASGPFSVYPALQRPDEVAGFLD